MAIIQENTSVVTVENGVGRFMDSPSHRPSDIMKILDVLNTVTHYTLGAVSIGVITLANAVYGTNFANHVYLCVIGYVVLMSQAILSFSPNTGWTRGFTHDNRKIIHWVMQVIGAILAIAGSLIAVVNEEKHFQSAHGTLGIIAFILTLLSLIGGLFHLFTSRSSTKPALTRLLHSGVGIVTITVAFSALIVAYSDYYSGFYFNNKTRNMYIAFTAIALAGTVMSACINFLKSLN